MVSRRHIIEGGYNTILPLSPSKILFLIHKNSLDRYDYLIKTMSLDDFVINTNVGILQNTINRDIGIDYQIYSSTNKIDKILPKNLHDKFFASNN